MTALPPRGWKPVTPGELDRLEKRLRARRLARNLGMAALVALAIGAASFGAVQAIGIVNGWIAPASGCGQTHVEPVGNRGDK